MRRMTLICWVFVGCGGGQETEATADTTPDGLPEVVVPEDVAFRDLTAEDLTAEDLTAENLTAEDLTAEEVESEDAVTHDDVADPVDIASADSWDPDTGQPDEDSVSPDPDASLLWAPTTTAFSADLCQNVTCTEVNVHAQGGHLGGAHVVAVEVAGLDDAIAQWQKCVGTVLECARGGAAFDGCVAGAACPELCKSTFAAGATGKPLSGQLDTFEAVFITEGGLCRPTEVTP